MAVNWQDYIKIANLILISMLSAATYDQQDYYSDPRKGFV